MPDELKFVDAEQYQGGSGNDSLSFKEILLRHVKRITELASREMRGGYWETRPSPSPSMTASIKIYVPDTREEYSNSIECLADLLFPYFDDEITKEEQELVQEEEKAEKEAFKNSNAKEARQTYRNERIKIRKKLFRQLSSFLQRKRYLELESYQE